MTMLRVEGIDLHYGASQALWRVSLNAVVGEITCVLGRNGVGKTSTLRAVVGQVKPSAGRIEWDGKDITGLSTVERARRGIALVPQGREIFPLLTVEENLQTGFGALPRGERRIPEHIFELFPILKTMLRRKGGDLSGGQQQQLAIGRALIMRPKLLVLDEPTEGIQPSIIKDIGRVLELLRSQGQMAILLVEQYLDFARQLADHLAVMDRGQVVLAGRPNELDDRDVRRYLTV
jgi:urea transport system ATP-binding protein